LELFNIFKFDKLIEGNSEVHNYILIKFNLFYALKVLF